VCRIFGDCSAAVGYTTSTTIAIFSPHFLALLFRVEEELKLRLSYLIGKGLPLRAIVFCDAKAVACLKRVVEVLTYCCA